MTTQLDETLNWYFKAVPGGHVFQLPRLYGPLRHYFVDAERKFVIGRILHRGMWFGLIMAAVLLVAFLASIAYVQDVSRPMGWEIYGLIAGSLLVASLGYALSRVYLLWELTPIVKELSTTDERITLVEKWRNVGARMSNGNISLGIVAGIMVALAGLIGYAGFGSDMAGAAVAYFNMAAGAAMAAPYIVLGCFKAMQRQPIVQEPPPPVTAQIVTEAL